LATLGVVRDMLELGRPQLGVAAVMSALPLLIPLVIILMRKLKTSEAQL
jgi:multiple sugar transport system permease protein